MRRFRVIFGLAALVALGSDQALIGSPRGSGTPDRWETRLRLFASEPTPHAEPSRGGALKVEIPGFGHVGRDGDLYLPTRTLRVAIPDSAGEVRLEAIHAVPRPLHGLDLDAPGEPGRRVGTRRQTATAAAAAAHGSGTPGAAPAPEGPYDFVPPGEPIRLGDVGWLRDQRFVEIVYTPVVAPPGGGEALFYPEVEVDLVVEDLLPGAVRDEPAAVDPLFEETYRRALINYEDGRRLRAAPGTISPTTATSAFQTEGAGIAAADVGIASGFPAYKLRISKDGVYRLSRAYLLDPNGGVAPGLSGADPRQFKIVNRGVEIPIFVQGEADGSFDASDFVEFYGQRLDGPETSLNFDLGLLPSIYQYEDYADTNVYWLVVDAIGTRRRMASRSSPPNGAFPVEPDFAETLHFETDSLFQPTGGADPFLMAPRLNSNTGSVAADANTCVYANPGIPSVANGNYLAPGISNPSDPHYCPSCRMALPGINTAAATPATVSVRVRGTTSEPAVTPDHLVVVEASGVASRSSATCFSAETFATTALSLTHAQLTNPLDIRIEEPGLAATALTEQLLVDWSEVSYRRLFQAVNDGLRFKVPDANRRIQITGLSTNVPANVVVYEITKTEAPLQALGGPALAVPVRVGGGAFGGSAGNFNLTFTSDDDPNSAADRVYVVAGSGTAGLLLPDSVVQDVASTLLDPTNEADVVVLGDPNLMDTTPGSAFMNYWSHRASVDGYAVKVVSILDVYDEFGSGIPHPQSIRDFLAYAYDNWKGPTLDPNRPPPSFLTIVGDTSADPKNILNRSDWVNLVPSFVMYQASAILGFYASDSFIGAFRGTDQLPDLHLGRIPIRTATDATNVFTKMLAYETTPLPASARGKGLFIADEGKAVGESSEFERITDEVINTFWQPQPPFSATRLYYDDPNYNNGNNPTKMQTDIKAALNAGVALQQFTGHGSFSIWGVDGYFDSTIVPTLTANGIYSFAINENCLSGGFHALAGDALSEAFLKAPGKGSIAFFAPAGLSFSFIGESINFQIYGDLFGPERVRRFGPLLSDVRTLLSNLGSIIDLQSYTLVGDPTLSFQLPAPAPPANLQAAGGNAVVNLSWTAAADPNARTKIYRATVPSGPYTDLTATPVAGALYADPNVVNATTYYYQVATVDGFGFEGARSNFNTDCVPADPNQSGPDCVWARPLNPNPPATPSGALVFPDGSGVRLVVEWDPNPETDLAQYRVQYGLSQGGPYPFTATAGPSATTMTIAGLTTGATYYLRLSARNTSGLESLPTPEMHSRPVVFEGQNPPKLIDDLRIVRTPGDPNSLTLSWSRPLVDIYGAPIVVAEFAIYRGTSPGFLPGPATLVHVVTDPNQTSWIDVGAHAAPASYYYAVGSTDVRGFVSGVLRELPSGIPDVGTESLSGDTVIRLSWPAVTMDVAGNPTSVAKYMVYAAGTPISRAQTDAMTPLLDNVTATSVDFAVNPVHRYYTVIVVDTRGNRSPF